MSLAYPESRAERYADAAIEAELAKLSAAGSGRNAALNTAALALGGFVGAGMLTEERATERLIEACEANGYLKKDGLSQARATIRSGLRKGTQSPRELPRDESAPPHRPSKAPRRKLGLAAFADERKIPLAALEHMGWQDTPRGIAISYTQPDGSPARTQFRDPAWCENRFAWDSDTKDLPIVAYQPDRALAGQLGYALICEGASDAATAVFAGLPAIGVPGESLVKKAILAEHLAGLTRVFVCVDTNEVGEPDSGGERFRIEVPKHLESLGFTGTVHELRVPKAKDMSALWARDPESFSAAMHEAMRAAVEPPKPPYLTLDQMAAECLRPVGKRLRTGFQTLDDATRGGIPLGRVVAVLGAPGAGKSTFCVQLADSFEQQGCAVTYVASDEPAEGIVTRLGQLAGFSREALESEGAAGDAVRAGFAGRSVGRALAVIDPDASEAMRTIEQAENALTHLALNGRPRVLFVDSLQTVQCAAAELAESAREKVDAKMSALKAIAKRGALVFVISEMARSGYRSGDRNVDTSALAAGKESGAIEYGVALLIGLRSVKGEHGQVDVEVAKNRLGGAKPELRLQLDSERASFAEVAMPDAQEQKTQAATHRRSEVHQKLQQTVLQYPGRLTSKTKLVAASGVRRADGFKAVDEMEVSGELSLDESGAYQLNQSGGWHGLE